MRVHPVWEFAFDLVVEADTSSCINHKALFGYAVIGATLHAFSAVLAGLHHPYFVPVVFKLTTREETPEAMQAAHPFDVAKVVTSILAQSTSHREKFEMHTPCSFEFMIWFFHNLLKYDFLDVSFNQPIAAIVGGESDFIHLSV